MIRQRTLINVVTGTGVGLHTGVKISINLRPAPVNTGIIFRRIDLDPIVEIPALNDYVSNTRLSTTLERNGARVCTVEHLMSAFAGLGIDNAYVDVTGGEVPIMDGSAEPFVFLMRSSGIQEQAAPKKFMKIKKRVEVKEGDMWAKFEPHNGFRVAFSIDFNHPVVRNSVQDAEMDFAESSYLKEVSRARTFGFLADLESLQESGLALGGSTQNAIVIDQYHVLNEDPLSDPLRYRDEFVRHKILDAIGDVYLLGYPLVGAFSAHKSGHYLNDRLLKELTADEAAWELVEYDDYESMPQTLVRDLVTTLDPSIA